MSGRADYNTSNPAARPLAMTATAASPALLVLCTCPDRAVAEQLAELVVTERLAACVNLVPGLTSVYWWAGAVERAYEVLLLAKTTAETFAALEARLRAAHPYELPEVIAVPIGTGSEPYLQWLTAAVSPTC